MPARRKRPGISLDRKAREQQKSRSAHRAQVRREQILEAHMQLPELRAHRRALQPVGDRNAQRRRIDRKYVENRISDLKKAIESFKGSEDQPAIRGMAANKTRQLAEFRKTRDRIIAAQFPYPPTDRKSTERRITQLRQSRRQLLRPKKR